MYVKIITRFCYALAGFLLAWTVTTYQYTDMVQKMSRMAAINHNTAVDQIERLRDRLAEAENWEEEPKRHSRDVELPNQARDVIPPSCRLVE